MSETVVVGQALYQGHDKFSSSVCNLQCHSATRSTHPEAYVEVMYWDTLLVVMSIMSMTRNRFDCVRRFT